MKKIKSILFSSFVVVSILFGFVACTNEPYEAPPTVSVWDGETVTTDWYTPEAKEYVLNSASDLAGLAVLVNGTETAEAINFEGKTIKLNIDIDLDNHQWTPIGQKGAKKNFSGTFDGSEHEIKGLVISGDFSDEQTFDGYVALFGAANGTVKNLTVSGEVSGINAAGIVARANANCIIENCVSNVDVTGTADGKAGGIVCLTNPDSENKTVIIRNCINNGTVKTGENGLGGIAGYVNKHSVIENCTNNGNIGTLVDKYAGGVAGYITGLDPNISKCINTGIISAAENAGGIAGIVTGQSNKTTIEECINTGAINGSDSSASGGILGSINTSAAITNCKNTAPIHGQFSGGVVGIAGGTDEKAENNIGEIINCNGGSAAITSPAFTLGFTGQKFEMEVPKNGAAGRVLGANAGRGPNGWTKIIVADGDAYESIGTVGICGIYTTWANLEIVDGVFHGKPLAGNTTYILFTNGTWEDKTPGKTYVCGGLSNNRKEEWVEQ